jgi:hypothetical protein
LNEVKIVIKNMIKIISMEVVVVRMKDKKEMEKMRTIKRLF